MYLWSLLHGHATSFWPGARGTPTECRHFTKLPLSWRWRPAAWPVWTHEIDRAVRFWTAADGRDQRAVDALANGRLDDITIDGPANDDELIAELLVERDVGRLVRHARLEACERRRLIGQLLAGGIAVVAVGHRAHQRRVLDHVQRRVAEGEIVPSASILAFNF